MDPKTRSPQRAKKSSPENIPRPPEPRLEQVPTGIGMAFLTVQHLATMRKGVMVEPPHRFARTKAVQVKDRSYVTPPNKDLSILHGQAERALPTP